VPEFTNLIPVRPPVLDLKAPKRLPVVARTLTLMAVVLPFLGVVAAAGLLWGWGFNWVILAILAVMTLGPGLGITVGFHRLFTHRSFETNKVVECLLGILGSMAVQGPLMQWVAIHRRHHQFSDHEGDPHSPHHHGKGIIGVVRGFWHAHIGWFFQPDPANLNRYVKDLRQSPTLRWVSYLFPVWVLGGLLIPTAMGYLLMGEWMGAVLGLVWGGLVRVFIGHHVTWSVNSVCHLWGSQPYPSHDQSKNNFLVGVMGLGEGWHNNHHAFPTSARHGLRWWQFDLSWLVIRGLVLLGLARAVKLPATQPVAQ
jgi:stearoyl-CoA desaturase (delta-9 desaturase)